ncbi:SRPBCC family protein [Rhodocista pekingensis]|uniref:SRPBCC family protein n=1 Tax=Rhodocista pekingensis TaxID=201185 RepID=A0ABW2KV66_9PROT
MSYDYGTGGRRPGAYGSDRPDDQDHGSYGSGRGSNYGGGYGGGGSAQGGGPGSYGRVGQGGWQGRQGQGGGMGGLSGGDAYQMAPLLVGGLMTALGVRRGGWLGYGIALAGLGVIQQAFSGRSAIRDWVGEEWLGERSGDHEQRAVTVSHSVTVNRPAEELFRFWRDFSNLPRFMHHLERVDVIDDRHSHWVAEGPAGLRVSWDAELTDEQENRRLAWRAVEGADVPNWGHVEFRPAPGGRGTEVQAVIRYEPPGGALGRAVARLLGREPQQQMRDDLNRFKRMMESGSDTTTAGQSAGERTTVGAAMERSSASGSSSGSPSGASGGASPGTAGGSAGSSGTITGDV